MTLRNAPFVGATMNNASTFVSAWWSPIPRSLNDKFGLLLIPGQLVIFSFPWKGLWRLFSALSQRPTLCPGLLKSVLRSSFFLGSKTKGDRFPHFFQHSSSLPTGHLLQGLPRWHSVIKNLPANAGDTGDAGSIPGSGRCPGGGNGNPFQYSCLENPIDRGTWRPTVHGITESPTRLSDWAHSMQASTPEAFRMTLNFFVTCWGGSPGSPCYLPPQNRT